MRSLQWLKGCEQISRMGSLALLGTSLGLMLLSSGPAAHAQLVITPTFDSSITGASNAAAIEATINSAISVYQTNFTNPINVTIQFKEMSTGLGQSNTTLYGLNYSTFINALTANASSADDATALLHLPTGVNNPVTNDTAIYVKTANIRALGIAGSFPPTFSGGFDGIIGLNTGITDIGNTGTTGQYSLFATIEHEIDEVLGLGSTLGSFSEPAPEDLYRYDSTGARTFSLATDNAYFSIDGTTDLARFNNLSNGADTGDWHTGGTTAQVQDAFATPGAHPTLGVEIRALDVIGYTRVATAATPEPSSFAMLGAGALALSGYGLRRRKRAGKTAA